MRRLHRGGVVDRAVRLIPVGDVLSKLGISFPGIPPAGSSYKIYCPFGDLHPDRGAEKEMRLYHDGKAFCHVCQRQYDSVTMFSQATGVSPMIAARQLLVDAGFAPETEDQGVRVAAEISPEELQVDALKALSVWADARGIDRLGDERYMKCAEVADRIQAPEHVQQWLVACKRILGGTDGAE